MFNSTLRAAAVTLILQTDLLKVSPVKSVHLPAQLVVSNSALRFGSAGGSRLRNAMKRPAANPAAKVARRPKRPALEVIRKRTAAKPIAKGARRPKRAALEVINLDERRNERAKFGPLRKNLVMSYTISFTPRP